MEGHAEFLSRLIDFWVDPRWLLLGGAALLFRFWVRLRSLRQGRYASWLFLQVPSNADPRAQARQDEQRGAVLSHPTPAANPTAWAAHGAAVPAADRAGLAQRAMERAARFAIADLRRGLPILAGIAATALDLGVFATLVGIIDANQGMTLDGRPGFGAL